MNGGASGHADTRGGASGNGASGNGASGGATAGHAGASGGAENAGRSAGGASTGGAAANAGGDARGGATTLGEGGMATGGTGSSVGGAGPKPGFACYGGDRCKPGERCVECDSGEDLVSEICTPSPTKDPSGYAAATASCLIVRSWFDCDGPEDCPHGEYCVLAPDRIGGQCQTDPAPDPATCCFTCDISRPMCTLCWVDNDCQMGFLCTPTEGAPNDVGGCQPAL
jgi:hypothetical protein